MILMTALAMTGREMDALSLMRQLGGQISDAGQIVGLRETFTERAYYVLLTAGQWHRCIDLLNPAARETHQLPYRSAATELAAGIAYVFAGRGAVALDSLLSAVAQLELRPAQGIRREAYAAVAFAYAQLGNAGQSRKYLDKLQRTGGAADHATRSITDFCADMAGRWLNDTEAVNRLKESARRDIAAGRYTLAGISLLGATVHGTEADFRLLEEVAGHRQGPLAEISRLIAVGTRTHDAKTLLAGGELAATLELDAVEARCMALAVDYRPSGRRPGRSKDCPGAAGHPRCHCGQPAHRSQQRQPSPDQQGTADCAARGQGRLQPRHCAGDGRLRPHGGRPPLPGLHQTGSYVQG